MLVSEVQNEKLRSPIFVTPSGIVMSVSSLQDIKAFSAIFFTDFGIEVVLQPAMSTSLGPMMALQFSRES